MRRAIRRRALPSQGSPLLSHSKSSSPPQRSLLINTVRVGEEHVGHSLVAWFVWVRSRVWRVGLLRWVGSESVPADEGGSTHTQHVDRPIGDGLCYVSSYQGGAKEFYVAYQQVRWMAMMVTYTPEPFAPQRLGLSPASQWYLSQIHQGVMLHRDLSILMSQPRFNHRRALITSCLAASKVLFSDSSQVVSLLSFLSHDDRRAVLCDMVLKRPNSDAARLLSVSGAAQLMLDMNTASWEDAVSVASAFDDVCGLWREPNIAEQLIALLLRHPSSSARRSLSRLLDGVPLLHVPRVRQLLSLSGQWALSLSLMPQQTDADANVEVLARFDLGDWGGALALASTSTADARAHATVMEQLIQQERTVLACQWLRLHDIARRRLVSARGAALLLAQLARRKHSVVEMEWYTCAIQDVVEQFTTHGYVGHAAVDIAAASALAACGAWEQVLALQPTTSMCLQPHHRDHGAKGSTDSPLPTLLLIASAAGGAPWSIVKDHATQLFLKAKMSGTAAREALIRCALEAGAWVEAISLFHGRTAAISPTVLDHPGLVRRWSSVCTQRDLFPFSSTSLLECGMWREAIDLERALGVGPRHDSAVGRHVFHRTDLWWLSLALAGSVERKVRVVLQLAASQRWAVGYMLLASSGLLDNERLQLRSLIVRCAARAISVRSSCSATTLLCNHDPRCQGSMHRAAWALQEDMQRPSTHSLDVVLPSLPWQEAISCIVRHTARPSISVFVRSLVQYVHHAQSGHGSDFGGVQSSVMLVLRLVARQRGRRQTKSSKFVLLFDAQRAGFAKGRTRQDEDDFSGDSQCPEGALQQADRFGSWYRAVQLLSKPISAVSRQPWSQLKDCPAPILAALCCSPLTCVTSDRITMCLASLTAAGRWDAAMDVLHCASRREVSPDIEVLVDMVEGVVGSIVPLQHVVGALRTHCHASVVSTVLRAFAERSASAAAGSWDGAIQVLSALALAGIRHLPTSIMQSIADVAPLPAVHVAINLLDAASRHRVTSPISMGIDAVQHIVTAAEAAGLEPTLDVIRSVRCSSRGLEDVSAISSGYALLGDGSGSNVIRYMAKEPLVSLWHVALGIVVRSQCATAKDINRALQLTALGCCECSTVVRAFQCYSYGFQCGDATERCGRTMLLNTTSQLTAAPNRGEMRRSISAVSVCVACCSMGQRGAWEAGLQLLQSTSLGHEMPPMLQTARMALLDTSCNYDDTLRTLLIEEKRKRGAPLFPRATCTMVRSVFPAMRPEQDPLWWFV